MNPIARYWHAALFGGALGWLLLHDQANLAWEAVLAAAAVGVALECYCVRHSDPRGGCPRPVPPPIIRIADPQFEENAALGSGKPAGHPDWVTGRLPAACNRDLDWLCLDTWPNAEYVGLIYGCDPDE